jgi:hypothetical protein
MQPGSVRGRGGRLGGGIEVMSGTDLGWFALYRKIEDSPVFQKPTLLQTWLKVLCRASHRPTSFMAQTGRGGQLVELQPGQLIFGRRAWGTEMGREPKGIERDMIELEKHGMIKRETTPHFTLVTVQKWADYQCPTNVPPMSHQTSEKMGHQKQAENPVNHSTNSHGGTQGCPTNVPPNSEAKQQNLSLYNKTIIQQEASCPGKDPDEGGGEEKPKREWKFHPADMEVATWMLERIQDITTVPRPNLEKWADTIRLMRERDKLTIKEIRDVFDWANNDDFWQTNILCPATLRKQFPKLTAKRNKSGGMNLKPVTEQPSMYPSLRAI